MLFPIVLVFCLISLCHCEEPKSCSQFDYLNQLLLKLVRLEVRGESLDKEIAKTNTNVQLTLSELKNEDTVIKSKINEFENLMKVYQINTDNVTETQNNKIKELNELINTMKNEDIIMKSKIKELDNLMKEFQIKTDSVIESQANKIEELNEHVKTVTTQTAEMKEKMVTPNIMFKAITVKDKSPSTGDTIIFQDVMFNYGDGYDENTGIFTSPITGNYMFGIHICLYAGKDFYYGIIKDGSVHTSGRFVDSTYTICYTADAMMRLDAGQKVWLKCLSGSSSSDRLYDYTSSTPNIWNTFSGMLVHV